MESRNSVPARLRRILHFSGVASRGEFLLYALVYLLAIVILAGFSGAASLVIFLVLLIPFLAVCARRLHDAGFSGWVLLVGLIPLIGQLALLRILIFSGSSGTLGNYLGLGTTLGSMIRGGIRGGAQGFRTGQRINSAMSPFIDTVANDRRVTYYMS